MHPPPTQLRALVAAHRSALLSDAPMVPPERWMERPAGHSRGGRDHLHAGRAESRPPLRHPFTGATTMIRRSFTALSLLLLAAAPLSAQMAGMKDHDPDKKAQGGALPAGWAGRPDGNAKITD